VDTSIPAPSNSPHTANRDSLLATASQSSDVCATFGTLHLLSVERGSTEGRDVEGAGSVVVSGGGQPTGARRIERGQATGGVQMDGMEVWEARRLWELCGVRDATDAIDSSLESLLLEGFNVSVPATWRPNGVPRSHGWWWCPTPIGRHAQGC
jgi:hypothetical protein